jgi:hypothetical protein
MDTTHDGYHPRSDPIRSDPEAGAFVVTWVRFCSRLYRAPPECVDPLQRTTIKATYGFRCTAHCVCLRRLFRKCSRQAVWCSAHEANDPDDVVHPDLCLRLAEIEPSLRGADECLRLGVVHDPLPAILLPLRSWANLAPKIDQCRIPSKSDRCHVATSFHVSLPLESYSAHKSQRNLSVAGFENPSPRELRNVRTRPLRYPRQQPSPTTCRSLATRACTS